MGRVMNNYTTELKNNVLTIKLDDIAAGWEQWVMLRSDAHHDSNSCNRKLETQHLDLAKERGALILDFGDLFDAMQGRKDRRGSYSDIRPEDVVENYFDSIVSHAAEDYRPYANNFVMLGHGNHETSVSHHCNLDLTSNLVYRLNSDTPGARVHVGGFGGWVRFACTIQKTVMQTIRLKYHHGFGGTQSPVTRGTIQTNRQAVYLPDADIVVNGHNHQDYLLAIKRERLSTKGTISHDLAWFARTPGYKDEYGNGFGGWSVEHGNAPTAQGCVWLRLFYDSMGRRSSVGFNLVLDVR